MTLAVNIAQGASNNVTFRNRIINGAMVINQRAASITSSGYSVDRFEFVGSVASKATISQDTSIYPTGFKASLKALSSSAYTVGASEVFMFRQPIEGFNTADLDWGTANAKTITISFWAYSSLTGTFGGAVENSDGNRCYVFSYLIPVANTWTQVSVTIAGDTTGTWIGATNGIGLRVAFSFGTGATLSGTAGVWGTTRYFAPTGATSVVGTNGATFYLTGVQLEAGTTASPFEYRQYGTELALCQRYYWNTQTTYFPGKANGTTQWFGSIYCPVSMRTTPTPSLTAGTSYCFVYNGNTGLSSTTGTSFTVNSISTNNIFMQVYHDGFSGLADNAIVTYRNGGTLAFSAEL